VGAGRAAAEHEESGLTAPPEPELTLLAEGREAELFLLPDGRVLRLLRAELPRAEERARLEAVALAAAREAGAPVPALFERLTRDGRTGLVMERLAGRDLLGLLARRPWLLPSVARRTGRLHAELNRVHGPAALPPLRESIAARIEGSDAVPAQLRDEAMRALDGLPDGDRLCHGDLHPGNIIAGPDRASIVDWTNAARGEPAADVARSWVVLEFSPLPPGASGFQRRAAELGRGSLLRGYLRAYLRASPIDTDSLGPWTRVRAIERLAQEIPGERESLLARLGRGSVRAPGS
jgi:aminoglycoside phosphotransferase (APT) family kinase protein